MSNVIALKSRPAVVPTVTEKAVAKDQVKGLYVRQDGLLGYYLFRYRLHGRRTRLSIGPVNDMTLRQAVAEAQRFAAWLDAGKDPQVERDSQRDAKENGPFTFERATEEWLALKLPGLKSEVHKRQLQSRLRALYPSLGKLPMAAITVEDVAKAFKPMWVDTHPTAIKTQRYLADIFQAAIDDERRTTSNPAAMKALKRKLPNVRKGPERHMAALPWQQLPAFWRELAERRGDGADALRFTILTGQRTAQVIESTLDQFRPDENLWVFEGEDVAKMKTDVVHRVAMGPVASGIARERKALIADMRSGVQPAHKRKMFDIANMTMLSVLGTMGYWGTEVADADRITVHGFRSTFRDWFEDNWHKLGIWENITDLKPVLIAEAQLSHTGGKSKVDAAYQRADKLAKRLEVMTKFEQFVTGEVRQ
jgi:integrase